MSELLHQKPWSPYVAGALAGVVLCLSVLVAGQYFGASTTFVRSAGFLEKSIVSDHVTNSPYFSKTKVKVDWQMLFVVGIILGSFGAARMSRDFSVTAVPPMWKERFGPARTKRFFIAFLGGIIAIFGARMAGG
jgi:uncharacterized membrane protein YdcZ (DUF606 family)